MQKEESRFLSFSLFCSLQLVLYFLFHNLSLSCAEKLFNSAFSLTSFSIACAHALNPDTTASGRERAIQKVWFFFNSGKKRSLSLDILKDFPSFVELPSSAPCLCVSSHTPVSQELLPSELSLSFSVLCYIASSSSPSFSFSSRTGVVTSSFSAFRLFLFLH